jgi:hypothetical protein
MHTNPINFNKTMLPCLFHPHTPKVMVGRFTFLLFLPNIIVGIWKERQEKAYC